MLTYLIFLCLGIGFTLVGQLTGDHLESEMEPLGLPLASLRFWTIFSSVFGATGLIFSLLFIFMPKFVVFLLAACFGLLAGKTFKKLLENLKTNSDVKSDDLIGKTAHVLLPITKKNNGKIRLYLGGRTLDLIAQVDKEKQYNVRDKVLIYKVNKNGSVQVTSPTN